MCTFVVSAFNSTNKIIAEQIAKHTVRSLQQTMKKEKAPLGHAEKKMIEKSRRRRRRRRRFAF